MNMKNRLLLAIVSLVAIGSIAFLTKNTWSKNSVLEEKNETSATLLNSKVEVLEKELSNKKKKDYSVSFYINDKVYSISLLEDGFSKPQVIEVVDAIELIEMEKYYTTSLMPKEVFESLPISDNMIFYSGLQSNLDPNFWIYTERVDQGESFKVRTFNVLTKESKVLFENKNSPNNQYAFKPIAISDDNSLVYFEALEFGSHLNNIGIWEFNLNSMSSTKINIHPNYNVTPKMSPDGKYFLYSSSSVPSDVHSPSNYLNIFDLVENKEIQIYANDNAYVGVKGWIKSN